VLEQLSVDFSEYFSDNVHDPQGSG